VKLGVRWHHRGVGTEAELLARARGGDDDAFCQLLQLHQAQVHAYIGRTVRSKDIVEDLAQETFLKAHRHLATYREESSLRVWLLGIARNETLAFLRDEERRRARERRTLKSALEGWLADRARTEPSGPAEEAQRLSALEDCIRGLSLTSAALVVDVYFKGRTTGKIARETGRQVGAVSMTLLRIRQALRRCIESRLATVGTKP